MKFVLVKAEKTQTVALALTYEHVVGYESKTCQEESQACWQMAKLQRTLQNSEGALCHKMNELEI
jgi:hypothetical protein